jgi:hypothetical protein
MEGERRYTDRRPCISIGMLIVYEMKYIKQNVQNLLLMVHEKGVLSLLDIHLSMVQEITTLSKLVDDDNLSTVEEV